MLTAASLGPARGVTLQVLYVMAVLIGMPFYSEASGGVETVFRYYPGAG